MCQARFLVPGILLVALASPVAAATPPATPLLRVSVNFDYDVAAGRAHQTDDLFLDTAARLVVVENSNDPFLTAARPWEITVHDRKARTRNVTALQHALAVSNVSALTGNCTVRSIYGHPSGIFDISWYDPRGGFSEFVVTVSGTENSCDEATTSLLQAIVAFARAEGIRRFGLALLPP